MVDFDDLHGAAERLSAATASLSDPCDAAIAQQYIKELRNRAKRERRKVEQLLKRA